MKNTDFIAVKTTKIYCLPTCPARQPLPDNVVHFKTTAGAERNGFRPCKRCFPDFPYGRWLDRGASVILNPPLEFDFSQCLNFLARSPLEPCHVVENNILYKVEKFEGKPALIKIQSSGQHTLSIDFLTQRPKKSIRAKVAKYVWHWFDLGTDLRPFYRMAGKDPVLKNVTRQLYGLRILTISDLFEALCWAIIGQQINLTFAYTLKKRFVESFGESLCFDNRRYYLFPTPQVISRQSVADLKRLQLTAKKSEYIIALARKIQQGELTKKRLGQTDGFEAARKALMHLHGVGQWTADYVSLRCLKDPAALPAAPLKTGDRIPDVTVRNEDNQELKLTRLVSRKPTVLVFYRGGWCPYCIPIGARPSQ